MHPSALLIIYIIFGQITKEYQKYNNIKQFDIINS